jgi:predicted pyridoxine 5'-phosphate oxidase superfamily flavin-nucleotide-binding protein
MAKIVSDNLVITIARKGEEKIHDLGRLFNENPNRVISIVGTVNEDGTPNTAPMSLFYSPDEKTIIAGMVKTSQTVANIKRNGYLIIEVLSEGDISFGILGRGEVIKEPLDYSDATLAIKISVKGVKRDTSPAQIVTSGPKSTPRSDKAVEYEEGVMQELAQLEV